MEAILPMAEARRRLSELVQKVAAGHPAIAIGRRGRIEAFIAPVTPSSSKRSPLAGLVQLVAHPAALDAAGAALHADFDASLERSATLLVRTLLVREPPAQPWVSAAERPERSKVRRPRSASKGGSVSNGAGASKASSVPKARAASRAQGAPKAPKAR